MLAQTPSQIFQSALRGKIESSMYSCLSTFNYLNYQEESRTPFRQLSVLNDETLAPKKHVDYFVETNQTIVLIPLVGAIDLKLENSDEFITVNQVHIFSIEKESTFSISNPYEIELVNFLQIRFNSKSQDSNKITFDLDIRNKVTTLAENENFCLSIGLFDARCEVIHHIKNNNHGLFTFVLNGAFEFQNRLLENRDGLKIWEVDKIEFEALSENAMLLIIDVLI